MDKTIIPIDKDNIMQVEEYPTGTIIRDKKGRIMKGSSAPGTVRTTEDAHNLHQIRRDQAREIALRAVNTVSKQANIIIPEDINPDMIGWYAINEDITTGLFSSDNLRNKVEAAKFIGHNTGMIDKSSDQQPGDITISSDMQELIRNIADIVRDK